MAEIGRIGGGSTLTKPTWKLANAPDTRYKDPVMLVKGEGENFFGVVDDLERNLREMAESSPISSLPALMNYGSSSSLAANWQLM